MKNGTAVFVFVLGLGLVLGLVLAFTGCPASFERDVSSSIGPPPPAGTQDAAAAASAGCLTCHVGIDTPSMHESPLVKIGCAECHGGDATVEKPSGAAGSGDAAYDAARKKAHVEPRFEEAWPTSGNPVQSYGLLNRERLEYVRFVNPGDLRVSHVTCGTCHAAEAKNVPTSIMAHSAMVPGAGLYNNGAASWKNYAVGEFYLPDGSAARAEPSPPPTDAERARGVVPAMEPYPRWETSQPGNVFRAFERGNAVNKRGPGTLGKIDAVFLTVAKTRLNDPNLWLLGTNDYPGEYRSSGCTACHVLYANETGPAAGWIGKHGSRGTSASGDATIPKDEPGHPIRHALTRRIPVSQCLTCHVHQGSGAIETYAGLVWWDGETDGEWVYKEDGSLREGDELKDLHARANPHTKVAQFSELHRDGWSFRKVYKRDEDGRLIDKDGKVVPFDDPKWAEKAVHLVDGHFEAGMHCVDCHTHQDHHGDGKLYGAMIDAVEIACADCHGTIAKEATLVTSNAAAASAPGGAGHDLAKTTTSFGKPRFERRGAKIIQRSMLEEDLEWEVTQVRDIVDPAHPSYNKAAAIAKTLETGGGAYGDAGAPRDKLAHSLDEMQCYTCHTSWAVSCQGCHLAQKTNVRSPLKHYWGEVTRNEVFYYSQGLRHDAFMLGKQGKVQGGKIGPVRSASAVTATTENGNRAIVTHQQPTISAEGFSGTAFSPYIPHTVRGKETRACTDCHVSAENDNNAELATLFVLGTNASNFVGEYVYVACEDEGIEAVKVTEGWEPQPVIGSDFHAIRHPESWKEHVANGRALEEAHGHGSSDARSLERRGEYLFIADGPGGLRVFDVANVANKDVAQRIVSAPFSPVGHHAHVATKQANAVILPASVPLDPKRTQDPANLEQRVHPLFSYAYVLDHLEGLITVDVDTFVDGDPSNNYIGRAATYNPDGKLDAARAGVLIGRYLYVCGVHGIMVVDVDDPTAPKLVAELGAMDGVLNPRAISVQLRYAAFVDQEGLKVLDVTFPERPRLVKDAFVNFADARDVHVSRTYAYVAAGDAGLAIVDVKRFEKPKLVETWNEGGAIDDAFAVTTGLTNASLYAYIADGRNGLRVVQLVSPKSNPAADAFSPVPHPELIATYKTAGRAVALSGGAQRDRGVDESGNQISVFGRLGSRPFTREEREAFYLKGGKLYTVSDDGKVDGKDPRTKAEPPSAKLRKEVEAIEVELAAAKEKLKKANPREKPKVQRDIEKIEARLEKAKADLDAALKAEGGGG